MRKAAALILALLFGFCLAAPQLFPVLACSKESHRRNSPTEDGYQAYLGSALQPFELATLAHPMALGSPREPVDVGGTTVAAYWPPLVKPGANFAESAISLGAMAFALLFAVPWRRRETWPLAAIGVLALLLAAGTPFNRLLYFVLPGWSSTGSPGRIEVLFLLAACALAGMAVDGIAERKAQILAAVGALVGVVLAVVLPTLANADGAAATLRGSATAGAMIGIVVAAIGTVLALFLAKRSLWAVPIGTAVVACLSYALVLVPFGAPLDPPKGDPNIRIAVVNDAWDIVTAQPAVLPPNLAALGGLHELSGYDSLTSRDAVEMLRTVNSGTDPAPPANGNMMFVKPSADPKELAACGVTEVWSRKGLPQLPPGESREGYVVQKVDGPGRVTGGRVLDGYDHLEIIFAHDAREMILRDRLSPEWKRSIDRVNNGDEGISVEGGRTWRKFIHTIDKERLQYLPAGLALGEKVATSAGFVLAVGFWLERKKRKIL